MAGNENSLQTPRARVRSSDYKGMVQSYAPEKPWLKGEKRSSAAGKGFGEGSDKTVICQTPAVSRGKEGAPQWINYLLSVW